MNKDYKLINSKTKEETICNKVTLEDGFDYYISELPTHGRADGLGFKGHHFYTISKAKIREIVFNKYDKKCAYCGTDLAKGWNVDHIKPQVFGGTNDLENLNPSCKECNNYKCHTNLEEYRKQLHKMLNEKLEYLFKSKTKMQVAINMGSIQHTLWDGKFYFER